MRPCSRRRFGGWWLIIFGAWPLLSDAVCVAQNSKPATSDAQSTESWQVIYIGDKPTLVTATTLEGLSYTLKVGKQAGDNYYASVAIAVYAVPDAFGFAIWMSSRSSGRRRSFQHAGAGSFFFASSSVL